MGTYITDVIDIPDLIGYVREATALQPPTLASFCPSLGVDDLEYELSQIETPLVQVAKYRAWDTPPPLGRRQGFKTIRGEIAPMGLSITLNEKELKRLNLLRAGGALGGGPNPLDDIYDDAFQVGQSVRVREEQARADLFLDGKVTIAENGFILEVDYGVPGSHIVTAATPHSTVATATPLTNFQAWETVFKADNGGRGPDFWLISTEEMGYLQLNAQIRNMAPVTGVVPGIIDRATVGAVFSAHGLAPFVIFDGMLPDTAGVNQRLIPANKAIGMRAGIANTLETAPPAGELMAGEGIIERSDANGLIVYVEQDIRPARVITTSEQVSLPVLRDAKALFVATVF